MGIYLRVTEKMWKCFFCREMFDKQIKKYFFVEEAMSARSCMCGKGHPETSHEVCVRCYDEYVGITYFCNMCGKTHRNKSDLRHHMRSDHLNA